MLDNAMRIQFQIKHLMWLVFTAASLAGLCRVIPRLAAALSLCTFVGFVCMMSVTAGVWVTRKLQDTWTRGELDRATQPRIVVFVKTAACVLLGMVVMIAALGVSVVGVGALLSFLIRITK